MYMESRKMVRMNVFHSFVFIAEYTDVEDALVDTAEEGGWGKPRGIDACTVPNGK